MLHRRLYDIAKSDLKAANILTKNGRYPQAIYLYSQAFEKATKSSAALYLVSYEKKSESEASDKLKYIHGHSLLRLITTIAKIFVDYETRLHVKKGGKANHILIKTVNKGIEDLQSRIPDKEGLIAFYEHNVKFFYERLYARLKGEPPLNTKLHGWKIMRELYMNPKTKYLEFITLAQILFSLLDGMDLYARYPMGDIGYKNVRYLDRPEIRRAYLSLGEMVGELVDLTPLVLNKIKCLKPL